MLHAVRTVLSLLLPGLLWLALAEPGARADRADRGGFDSPVLVELFTSQGCNACPPADRLLAELSRRDDVIALSLHVDYWDYLGWRDTFAQAQFTERQKAYRDAWQKNVVYTPQIVVNGMKPVAATDPGAVRRAIAEAREMPSPVEVSIRRAGGMIKCRIAPGQEPVTGTVWIATYRKRATVEIERGENAGRTVTYVNVVRSLNRMGTWSGGAAEEVEIPQPGPGEGVAIWIQDGEAGPVLAAARIESPE